MSQSVPQRPSVRQLLSGLLILILIAATCFRLLAPASAAQLGQRKLVLTNTTASATTGYQLSFHLVTPGTLGSIEIQFCANDPFVADPCVFPTGFDASNAQLVLQTGQTGFSIDTADSNSNTVVLSRPASVAPASAVSYALTSMLNPSVGGSYFVRIQTFASTDATGIASDYGGIAFAINNLVSINAEVPPYLIFCTGVSITGLNCANASGDQINLGEFSNTHTSQAISQMITATNAADGYNITMVGTTLTSGNNVIAAIAANDVSRPGTPQFGMNLRANTSPTGGIDPTGTGMGIPTTNYNQPNFYRFVSNEVIASSPGPDNLREYTANYLVNVPLNQAPGVYVSTLTYIALATF